MPGDISLLSPVYTWPCLPTDALGKHSTPARSIRVPIPLNAEKLFYRTALDVRIPSVSPWSPDIGSFVDAIPNGVGTGDKWLVIGVIPRKPDRLCRSLD